MKSLAPLLHITVFLMTGCASQVPDAIRATPEPAITISTARSDISRVEGQRVRWGGTIASIENRSSETWLEVVERPLGNSGRPRETDQSGGRFLAIVTGFLDPAVFAVDREITVIGTLSGQQTRLVGAYPYQFPVVKAEQHYLWPLRPPPQNIDPWPYYPPFYYPPYFWPHPYYR